MGLLDELDVSGVTGHIAYDSYVAVRTKQGGRDVYTFHLPLEDVPRVLPVPDPERPTPGNRRVNAKHAKDFGRYVRSQLDWVAPPLLMRDSNECKFEPQTALPDGSEIGILKIPRNSRTALKIIDGQHRILGLDAVVKDLDLEIDQAREQLAQATAAINDLNGAS